MLNVTTGYPVSGSIVISPAGPTVIRSFGEYFVSPTPLYPCPVYTCPIRTEPPTTIVMSVDAPVSYLGVIVSLALSDDIPETTPSGVTVNTSSFPDLNVYSQFVA